MPGNSAVTRLGVRAAMNNPAWQAIVPARQSLGRDVLCRRGGPLRRSRPGSGEPADLSDLGRGPAVHHQTRQAHPRKHRIHPGRRRQPRVPS